MEKNAKIYISGHRGMVGAAMCRALKKEGFTNLVAASHKELDLREQSAVRTFFEREKPDYVILAAAKVGGIHANAAYGAEFIYDNIMIEANVIDAAWRNGVKKLLFVGSSCIYPKFASQPIVENSLMSGPLEPTNDCYALAKISGIRMCRAYRVQYGFDAISILPTNLYGPGDSYHPMNSHVTPAMIRRFHEAKLADMPEVAIWGTGNARREFMHVDDMADASLFLMKNYSDGMHINIGCGEDMRILDFAQLVADVVGYKGKISTDPSKPDGTPRKIMDSSRLFSMGWRPRISLRKGLEQTYKWYCENYDHLRQ